MKIAKIRDVKTPTRGTAKSAGLDFYVPNEPAYQYHLCSVAPGNRINIPSGIKVAIPPGFALVAFNKSGIALSHGLQVGACVIDEDYQGEIHLNLFNVSQHDVVISAGMKLVQFVLVPVSYVSVEVVQEHELYGSISERGTGGFGSTNELNWDGDKYSRK